MGEACLLNGMRSYMNGEDLFAQGNEFCPQLPTLKGNQPENEVHP